MFGSWVSIELSFSSSFCFITFKSLFVLNSLLSVTLILICGIGIVRFLLSSIFLGMVSMAVILELKNCGVRSSGVPHSEDVCVSMSLRYGLMTLRNLCCSRVCRIMYLISRPGPLTAFYFIVLLLTFLRTLYAKVYYGGRPILSSKFDPLVVLYISLFDGSWKK